MSRRSDDIYIPDDDAHDGSYAEAVPEENSYDADYNNLDEDMHEDNNNSSKQFSSSTPKLFDDNDNNNLEKDDFKTDPRFTLNPSDEDKELDEKSKSIPQPASGYNKKSVYARVPGNAALPIIYQCSLCPAQSRWRNRLKRHLTSCFKRSGKRNVGSGARKGITRARFRCEYCYSTTESLDDLLSHKNQQHAELIQIGLVECAHCNFTFFTFEELEIHMEEVANSGVEIEFARLGRKSVNQKSEISKNKISLEEQELLNDLIKKKLVTVEYVHCDDEDSNEDEIPPDSEEIKPTENFACQFCVYEISDPDLLSIHEQIKHREQDSKKLYACPKGNCGFKAFIEKHFRVHLMKRHKIRLDAIKIVQTDEHSKNIKQGGILKTKKSLQEKFENPEKSEPVSKPNSGAKQTYGCPKPNCFFHTNDEVEMFDHHVRRHSVFNLFYTPVFYCPISQCQFRAPRSYMVVKHLTKRHYVQLGNIEWSEIIQTFRRLVCVECQFEAEDTKSFKTHFRTNHWRPTVIDKPPPPSSLPGSLLFKCSECSFETRIKRGAFRHGYRHLRKNNKKSSIKFHKFVDDKPRGQVVYKYSNKDLRRCYKCSYIGATRDDLVDHNKRIHLKYPKALMKQLRHSNKQKGKRTQLKMVKVGTVANKALAKTSKLKKDRLKRKRKVNQEVADGTKSGATAIVDYHRQRRRIQSLGQKENRNKLKKEPQALSITTTTEESKQIAIHNTNENSIDNQENKSDEELLQITDDWISALVDKVIILNNGKTNTIEEVITIKLVDKNLQKKNPTKKSPPKATEKILFKCSICNKTFNRKYLNNHSKVHRKQLNEPNVKVLYSILQVGAPAGNLIIKDVAAVSAQFDCTECNFKTHEKEMLTKHQKLHWNKEKEAVYIKQKCRECLYQTCDEELFRKHCEKHKLDTPNIYYS